MADTTIGVSADVKSRLEDMKEESDADTWDGFFDLTAAGALDIDPDDLDEYPVEKRERVEQTRATVVGVLEGLDEADMLDEAVEIISTLTEQSMLSEHQRIVDYFIEKSKSGSEVTEMDRLLAQMVIETEGQRDPTSPAAEIARALFGEKTTAERSTTRQQSAEIDAHEDDDAALEEESAEELSVTNTAAYSVETDDEEV